MSEKKRETTEQEKKDRRSNEGRRRKARVSYDATGDPLGVPIWLNAAELRALDVDPITCTRVAYCVRNGEIRLAPPEREVLEE